MIFHFGGSTFILLFDLGFLVFRNYLTHHHHHHEFCLDGTTQSTKQVRTHICFKGYAEIGLPPKKAGVYEVCRCFSFFDDLITHLNYYYKKNTII